MANIYYGFSSSGMEDQVKVVYGKDIPETGLAEGDSINVYFSQGNTVAEPTLNIYNKNNDTTDAGQFIRSIDGVAKLNYMWRAGQVVLFTLTSQKTNTDISAEENGAIGDVNENSSNTGVSEDESGDSTGAQTSETTESGETTGAEGGETTEPQDPVEPTEPAEETTEEAPNVTLYYYMNVGVRANSTYYGQTKLFTDDEDYDVKSWLIAEVVDDPDLTTAATPFLVKKVYDILVGKQEEEKVPEINYHSDYETGQQIGTLNVGTNQYSIKIPSMDSISNTSQLVNDADIINGEGPAKIHNRLKNPPDNINTGYYFITDYIDTGKLYLKGDGVNSEIGFYATIPNDNGDIVTPIDGKLTPKSFLVRKNNTTVLNEDFKDKPNYIYGSPVVIRSNWEGDLRDVISFNPNSVESKYWVYAPNFVEGDKSLIDKYSRKLKRVSLRLGWGPDDSNHSAVGYFAYWLPGTGWVKGRSEWKSKMSPIIVGKGETTGHRHIVISGASFLNNLEAVAIAGWNISYINTNTAPVNPGWYVSGSTGSDASYQMLWELYLSNISRGSFHINYDTRNFKNGTAVFVIDVDVLFVDYS